MFLPIFSCLNELLNVNYVLSLKLVFHLHNLDLHRLGLINVSYVFALSFSIYSPNLSFN